MIAAKTINELAVAVEDIRKNKRDYRADTRKLTYTEQGTIQMVLPTGIVQHTPTRLCEEQIGDRVGIPRKYFDRMKAEAPALLARNVNHWFNQQPETRLVRTIHSESNPVARAFLSDRYRPLDNAQLMGAILPELANLQCEVKSCELTERRIYLQVVTPQLQHVIQRINPTQHVAPSRGVDDIVQAGLVISNSEVGCGALKVEPMIYRLACLNGLIVAAAMRQNHATGRGGGSDEAEPTEVFADETLKAMDRAFWLKVRDVVRSSVNQVEFLRTCRKLEEATRHELGKPLEIVETAAVKLGLSDSEGESVLQHLCQGGDLTKYGLIQAVTRTAEDLEDYDRAIELERMGGVLLETKSDDLRKN